MEAATVRSGGVIQTCAYLPLRCYRERSLRNQSASSLPKHVSITPRIQSYFAQWNALANPRPDIAPQRLERKVIL